MGGTAIPGGATLRLFVNGTQVGSQATAGAVVTLEAIPGAGSTFTDWSGACTGMGSCTVTLTQNKSVTANFKRKWR